LRAEEIQVATACRGRAFDKIEVGIREPGHASYGKVIGTFRLRLGVDQNGAAGWTEAESKSRGTMEPLDRKRFVSVAEEFAVVRGARGLQTEQHASGFQNGGFPLRIPADDDCATGRGFEFERLEAAKLMQADFVKHGRLHNDCFKAKWETEKGWLVLI
jgi:hypothetical protein